MRAAIFPNSDPSARAICIVISDETHVALNTPRGGVWRQIAPYDSADPKTYRRASDVPPLGQLPAMSTQS